MRTAQTLFTATLVISLISSARVQGADRLTTFVEIKTAFLTACLERQIGPVEAPAPPEAPADLQTFCACNVAHLVRVVDREEAVKAYLDKTITPHLASQIADAWKACLPVTASR